MKALMKWESGACHVALRETERPVPGPDEVLIRVAAAGICGTDIKIWHGTTWSNPPVILGHEYSGVVVGLGRNVTGLQPGDRVVSELSLIHI